RARELVWRSAYLPDRAEEEPDGEDEGGEEELEPPRRSSFPRARGSTILAACRGGSAPPSSLHSGARGRAGPSTGVTIAGSRRSARTDDPALSAGLAVLFGNS